MRLYSMWASVKVCPHANSHCEYCTLSQMEQQLWLHHTEWLFLHFCSRCQTQVSQLMSISSSCGHLQGSQRLAIYTHRDKIILPAHRDKTIWFCDPLQTLSWNPCLCVWIHICMRVEMGGPNSWQDTERCLCSGCSLTLPPVLLYFPQAVEMGETNYLWWGLGEAQKRFRPFPLPSLKMVDMQPGKQVIKNSRREV